MVRPAKVPIEKSLNVLDHGPATYEINGDSIKCAICGSVSYHTDDIAQRYCGRCQRFHEDRMIA